MSSFSRYRLVRALRRGGMAEVHEALALGDHGFERRVAIKRLPPGQEPSEEDVASFVDEARLASRLHHPNIVSVLDFGLHEDLPFMALEWVDGADLSVLVERAAAVQRPIPEPVALHVVTEVAHALAHAHRARGPNGQLLNLVHRDVSPQNILISYAGDVKLTDFGIARASDRLSRTVAGQTQGKLSWMSPEQAQATSVDARSDVFSLGCVLLWALTKKSPLADPETRMRTMQGVDFSIPKELPEDIYPIVRRATRVRAAQRYESAQEMARETGAALSSRLDRDARGALMNWLEHVGHAHTVEAQHPLAEMMGFDLVLDGPENPVRRFASHGRPEPRPNTVHQENSELTRVLRPTSEEPPPQPVKDPRHLGQVLHGFRLVEALGQGASALVYRAEHNVLGREAAIKILTADAARHPSVVRRLMREAETLARLDHPNIVSVQDFGYTEDGAPFMTMELVNGVTLHDALRVDGPLTPERTASIVVQIAEALAEAHAQGVIHRDLKLGNIMLVGGRGVEIVKVLDFGIARLISQPGTQITGADALLGTPQYMAPEQFTSPAEVGPPADVYGLGVVTYILIAGQMPFPGQRLEVLQYKLRDECRPLRTDTGLEPLVFQMLAFDPGARPTPTEIVQFLSRLPRKSIKDRGPTAALTAPNPPAAAAPSPPAPRVQLGPAEPTQGTPTEPPWHSFAPRWLGVLAFAAAGFILAVVLGIALLGLDSEPIPAPVDPPPPRVRSPARPPTAAIERPLPLDPSPVAVPYVRTAPRDAPNATPTSPSPPTTKRPPRRPTTPRVSREKVDREVAKRFRQAGLTAHDVASNPAYLRARRDLERATARGDRELVERALDAVNTALRSIEIDEPFLSDKLTRIEALLHDLPPDVVEDLERRYLDARASLRSASTSSARRRLSRSLGELETAVRRAGR